MTDYKVGDEVICVLDENGYLNEVKVQIIGTGNGEDSSQLLCFVPQYLNVVASFKLIKYHQKQYRFADKFLGEYGTFINKAIIKQHIPAVPAQTCGNCLSIIHFAEPPAEGTYTCRACRDNPFR